MSNDTDSNSIGVECIIPILNVSNLVASVAFYRSVLGFEVDWTEGTMASVSCDGRAIMLCQQDQGHPGAWIWIGVDDIEPLFDTFGAKGAKVRQKPINRPWAYEMQIEDLDGHVLRFGSDLKSAQPFM